MNLFGEETIIIPNIRSHSYLDTDPDYEARGFGFDPHDEHLCDKYLYVFNNNNI